MPRPRTWPLEIERWLADEPVACYREPAPARLARWGRRHKPIVAGAAALLLTAVAALSAGIVLVGREQRKTETQRREAVQQRELVSRESRITPPPRRGQPREPRVPRIPRRQRRPGRPAPGRLPGRPQGVGMGIRPAAGTLGAQDLRGLEPGSRRLVGGVFTRLLAPGLRLRPWGYVGDGPNRRAARALGPDRCRGLRPPRSDRGGAGPGVLAGRTPARGGLGFHWQGSRGGAGRLRHPRRPQSVGEAGARRPDPQPGVFPRRPLDRQRLRIVQRLRGGRFRPAAGRRDR